MELIYQKRCEDWGWFIDIENNKFINHNYEIQQSILKLPVIKEDEEECEDDYDYYRKIYKDTEEIYLNKEIEEQIYEKETNILIYKFQNLLFKLSSRTILTIITGCIIFSFLNSTH
jgi:hypothetical protein